MEGRVLGPISADVPGRTGVSGGTMAAALFGLLVTSRNRRCTKGEIAMYLWPGMAYSEQLVCWVVSDLRKRLGSEIVPRVKSGICEIRVPDESVDYLRFRSDVCQAASLGPAERFARLSKALAEWRDEEPLRDVPGPEFAKRRSELQAERMRAICEQLDAAWHAQEDKWLHEETDKLYRRVHEIESIFPEIETIFNFYLLSWGLELRPNVLKSRIEKWKKRFGLPGRDLQKTIDRVLRTPSRMHETNTLVPVPDQLPLPGREARGRGEEVIALEKDIRKRQRSASGAVVVISGMAGVGKSTVAYRVAARVKALFPDGVLFANLQGFADAAIEPTEPERVLDRFLSDLQVPYREIGVEGKSAELRSVLAHRSVLLVLDDVASAEQVRPLLPGAGASAAIITSRNMLSGLRASLDIHVEKIEPLENEASIEILEEAIPDDARGKYRNELADLVQLCDGLPLALTVIACRLDGGRPRHTIPALVRELNRDQQKLDALDLPKNEASVRLALDYSVRKLSSDARRLLWQLAVHPGPTIGWEAVIDLGQAGGGIRADHAVEELVAANLVGFSSERYHLHDLVRNYARYHVTSEGDGSAENLEAETLRLTLEYQLHNARACDRLLDHERRLPIGEPDGITVTEPEDLEQAMAILDDEYDTMLSGIQLAIDRGLAHYIWLLPMVLVTYQWKRYHLADALRGLQRAVDAVDSAESVVSPTDLAMLYRMLAGTHWRREEFDSAAGRLRRAIRLSEQDAGEAGRLSLARSQHALAITLRKQGNGADAEEHHWRALRLYRELSDPVGEAASLNGIGTLYYDRGEYGEALRFCTEARCIAEETDDWDNRADVLYTLAKIHTSRAERNEALVLFREAWEIYRELDDRPSEVKCLGFYADVLVTAGHSGEAVEALERILVLRDQMGDQDVQDIRNRLEGLR